MNDRFRMQRKRPLYSQHVGASLLGSLGAVLPTGSFWRPKKR